MGRYRKRPMEVEAVQWWSFEKTPDNLFPGFFRGMVHKVPFLLALSIGLSLGLRGHKHPPQSCGYIYTPTSGEVVCPGDFLVMDEKNMIHVCKQSYFKIIFEEIS